MESPRHPGASVSPSLFQRKRIELHLFSKTCLPAHRRRTTAYASASKSSDYRANLGWASGIRDAIASHAQAVTGNRAGLCYCALCAQTSLELKDLSPSLARSNP